MSAAYLLTADDVPTLRKLSDFAKRQSHLSQPPVSDHMRFMGAYFAVLVDEIEGGRS